jgi:hypothetical protein
MMNMPDVSMVATSLFVYCQNGDGFGVAGTSASSPLWAGFMALVNQQAAANGKPPIGFANPALYAIGKGTNYQTDFHDITTGNTNNGNGASFNAVPGYDLATGWGSPAGQALISDLAGSIPVSSAVKIISVSPACAPVGGSVTIVWSWSGNSANANVDYVVGFGSSASPSCSGDIWTSPYACNGSGNGVLNPTNAGTTASGTATTVVKVPAGAPSGNILLGYALSCGTVQFTAANSNCGGSNNWTASVFTICAGGTATPTPTLTPTRTVTPTPTNTPINVNTPTPTWTPTPTSTPVPATATFTPVITNTPTFTHTPAPPTATPTNTLLLTPSATQSPTATRTNTPMPPTATFTPIPPTATFTPSSKCAGVAAWSGNSVAYKAGNKVTYPESGVNHLFSCIQAHTSQAGWTPPAVPALWQDLGTCN